MERRGGEGSPLTVCLAAAAAAAAGFMPGNILRRTTCPAHPTSPRARPHYRRPLPPSPPPPHNRSRRLLSRVCRPATADDQQLTDLPNTFTCPL